MKKSSFLLVVLIIFSSSAYGENTNLSQLLFLGNGEYQPQILGMHKFSEQNGLLVMSEFSSTYQLKLVHYFGGKISVTTLDDSLFLSKIKSFVDNEGNYHLVYFNSTADVNHVKITQNLDVSYLEGFNYDSSVYNLGLYDVQFSGEKLIHFLFNIENQTLEIRFDSLQYVLQNTTVKSIATLAKNNLMYFQVRNNKNVTVYKYDLETRQMNSFSIVTPNFLNFGLGSFPNGSAFSYVVERENGLESLVAGGNLKIFNLKESFLSNGTNGINFSLPEKIFRKDIIVEFTSKDSIRLTGNEIFDRTKSTRYSPVQYEWVNGVWQQNWIVESFSVSNNEIEGIKKVSNTENSFVEYVNGFPPDLVTKYGLKAEASEEGAYEERGILLISNEISFDSVYLVDVTPNNNFLLYGAFAVSIVILVGIIIRRKKQKMKKTKNRIL